MTLPSLHTRQHLPHAARWLALLLAALALGAPAGALDPTTAPIWIWGWVGVDTMPAAFAITVTGAKSSEAVTAGADVRTAGNARYYVAEFAPERLPASPFTFTFAAPDGKPGPSATLGAWPGRLDYASTTTLTTSPCEFLLAAVERQPGEKVTVSAVVHCTGLGNASVRGDLKSDRYLRAPKTGAAGSDLLKEGLTILSFEASSSTAPDATVDRVSWEPAAAGAVPAFSQLVPVQEDGHAFAATLTQDPSEVSPSTPNVVPLLPLATEVRADRFDYLRLEMECDFPSESKAREALTSWVLMDEPGTLTPTALSLQTAVVRPVSGRGIWVSALWLLDKKLSWKGASLRYVVTNDDLKKQKKEQAKARKVFPAKVRLRYLGKFVPASAGGSF
ncbi:MAG: hypothetical protein HY816_00510 [Candidatus Wallbacteria bacterium]|nr:hypothetical protein [Candidatus Wallbacteria bacterium]